ncbi:restriction endonuclease [Persephonella sp.]
MALDFIDISLIAVIAGIVGYYIYIRLKEEKRKKEKELIPNLEYLKKKYTEEKKHYSLKAQKFKEKIKEFSNRLQSIKNLSFQYRWTEDEKKLLKRLKGTEFEWTFSFMLQILGFKVQEPPVYRDRNVDFIVEIGRYRLCVDFADAQQVKKINRKYISSLVEGAEKYRCDGIWIITNGVLPQEVKSYILSKGILIFEFADIVRFFPSIRIVEDFYETETKLHNYELLYKETSDEVIRRDTWIKEVEEKLKDAYEKLENKKAVAK